MILSWVIFFSILAWLVLANLSLASIHCQLYLLITGYFCIPINILESCSWMHLSYLKTVWFFPALLLIFLMWDQHSTQSWTNYSPQLQTLLALILWVDLFPILHFLHMYVLSVLIIFKGRHSADLQDSCSLPSSSFQFLNVFTWWYSVLWSEPCCFLQTLIFIFLSQWMG